MRKLLLVLITVILTMLCVGCDTNSIRNVDTYIDEGLINTTQTLKINTYNGYKVTSVDQSKENENGETTITIKVKNPDK